MKRPSRFRRLPPGKKAARRERRVAAAMERERRRDEERIKEEVSPPALRGSRPNLRVLRLLLASQALARL